MSRRGGDPLLGSRTHVADRKDIGNTGLEGHRKALERPAGGTRRPWAADHVAVVIALDRLGKPGGVRAGADEDEQRRRLDPGLLSTLDVPEEKPLQVAIPGGLHDLALKAHLDVLRRLDLAAEVVGHVGTQVIPANQHRHPARRAGEVQGRLTGASCHPRSRRRAAR